MSKNLHHHPRVLPFFFLMLLLLVGCRENKLSEVSGSVTYDGKPLEQGSIAFVPVDGMAQSGGGAIIQGKYVARNVPAGMAKVRITGAQVTGEKKMDYGANPQTVITATEMLPAKYNTATELTYEVKPGNQIKDFDLAK